jgi:hypothetical protein
MATPFFQTPYIPAYDSLKHPDSTPGQERMSDLAWGNFKTEFAKFYTYGVTRELTWNGSDEQREFYIAGTFSTYLTSQGLKKEDFDDSGKNSTFKQELLNICTNKEQTAKALRDQIWSIGVENGKFVGEHKEKPELLTPYRPAFFAIQNTTIEYALKGQGEQFRKHVLLDLGILNKDIYPLCEDNQLPVEGPMLGITVGGRVSKATLLEKGFRQDSSNTLKYTKGDYSVIFSTNSSGAICARIVSYPAGVTTDRIKTDLSDFIAEIRFTDPDGKTTNSAGFPAPAAPPPSVVEEATDTAGAFGKFDQQCILIKNIDRFIGRINPPNLDPNYNNIIKLDVKNRQDARSIGNLINGSQYFLPFVNVPNHVLASLVPKIRLIKTYIVDKKTVDVELPLENFIDPSDILKDNIGKSFGYGLDSFSWENTSFNETDRNISATLTMKFATLDSFTKERKGIVLTPGFRDNPLYTNFKFLELIYQVPTKAGKDPNIKVQEGARFRIKVIVGWEYSRKVLSELVNASELGALEKAIKANTIVLYLYNKGHDLKFEQDGTLSVTINYQSSQEAILNDEIRANILQKKNAEAESERSKLEAIIEDKKEDESPVAKEEIKSAREKLEKLSMDSTFKVYADFLDEFISSGFMKAAVIKVEDLVALKLAMYSVNPAPTVPITWDTELEKTFNDSVPTFDHDAIKAPGTSAEEKHSAMVGDISAIKARISSESTTKKTLVYFHLGELLNLVLGRLNNEAETPDDFIRLIVGPFMYRTKIKPSEVKAEGDRGVLPQVGTENGPKNLADIPISLEYFLDWFQSEVIDQRKKVYTLRNFLSDVIAKFILQLLSPTCFGSSFELSRTKVDINLLSASPREGNIDRVTGKSLSDKSVGGTIELTNSIKEMLDQAGRFNDLKSVGLINYIYLQALNIDTDTNGIIDEIQNSKEGIYHLRMGSDRGLVKEINFSKDDLTSMAVAIYTQQGSVNQRILRKPYNADVSLVGNNMFKPGTNLYIDGSYAFKTPSSDRNALLELGLGGFYIVTKTNNSIAAGKFDTNIACRFIRYGQFPRGR